MELQVETDQRRADLELNAKCRGGVPAEGTAGGLCTGRWLGAVRWRRPPSCGWRCRLWLVSKRAPTFTCDLKFLPNSIVSKNGRCLGMFFWLFFLLCPNPYPSTASKQNTGYLIVLWKLFKGSLILMCYVFACRIN